MRTLLSWPILLYLRFLAKIALSFYSPLIIGIAGSVGKSSTRNALAAILSSYAKTKIITGNSETGIPLGILGITGVDFSIRGWLIMLLRAPFGIAYLKGTKYLIVEMGIDDPSPPKNMGYLLSILKPDYAISLNISPTHTQQFEKTLKGTEPLSDEKKLAFLLTKIAEEDVKIITESDCEIGIYNADDSYIKKQIDDYLVLHRNTTLLSFGKGAHNDISYAGYSVQLTGTSFSFLIKGETRVEKLTLFLEGYVLPKEYQEVIAAALITSYRLGITPAQMKSAFESNFSLPKGRSTLLSGIRKSIIVDSSYNASPSAVSAFLALFKDLQGKTARPTVFLFGDMRELGNEAKETHEAIAKKIPGSIQYLYLVGPLTKEYVLPLVKDHASLKEVRWFSDAHAAGKYLKENIPSESQILVKGSQNTIFLEEAIPYFLSDKHDRRLLCRQDRFWKARKDAYFKSL